VKPKIRKGKRNFVFCVSSLLLLAALGFAVPQKTSQPATGGLGGNKNEFEVDVFFAKDSAVLDAAAIKDLSNLADIAKSLNGYMIEIAGYSSNTLTSEADLKVSVERATAVARYFLNVKNIPMERILVPVGYGSKLPVASNRDAQGRELNRHVDIKILVNKRLDQGP
jgi:outer membrane protein OmpA-like peptidoglycan-associated protein